MSFKDASRLLLATHPLVWFCIALVLLAVVAVVGAVILFALYRWCRAEVWTEGEDEDFAPPPEVVARLDENGRVELVVDEPEPPLLIKDREAGKGRGRRKSRPCEHCGRRPVVRRCPYCRLKLCSMHDECPECGAG